LTVESLVTCQPQKSVEKSHSKPGGVSWAKTANAVQSTGILEIVIEKKIQI